MHGRPTFPWVRVAIAVLVLVGGVLAISLPVQLGMARRREQAWQDGKRLVEAVYEHRAKTGKWPGDLSALVPAYLPALPDRWTYRPASPDWAPLLSTMAGGHHMLKYYFPPASEGELPGADRGWVDEDIDGSERQYLGP
jgi:hypothetical protein